MILNHARRQWIIRQGLSLLTAACMATVTSAASPQNQAPPSAAVAQSAAAENRPITFETVSIQKHLEPLSYGPGFTPDGCQFHGISVNAMLFSLYADGNRVPLLGLPSWGLQETYDILAKVPEADIPAWGKLDYKYRNLAIEALLKDRFQLAYHHETREMPIFNLIIAKNGPKLKEAIPGDKYENGAKSLNGSPLHGILMGMRNGDFVGQDMTSDQIAAALVLGAGRPVTNQTGLTGHYDITLKPDIQQRPPPSPTDAGEASDPTGPSFFTIVQEQLGLKLEPAKGPVPLVVIDHIERPSEN